MFLKSLTLKGFKSFADPTTLQMEPGVTVVVGPNGSGKSNVVDAVAWVLGAQGPRTVRSQKMEDVIFAGAAQRPALGRAEVSLTIDNRAGRLPGGLAEITITRTLFRSGDSEYALNGQPCRLLDIQELLSDSGVGRQQHVIVSQGQLDSILNARPEERRAVIEEAAGVLKHRRRRERAERRLAATEENLERLSDLLREVRRQMRPLERQAQAARSHSELATELRALRLHIVGTDLAALAERRRSASVEKDLVLEDESQLRSAVSDIDAAADRATAELATRREEDLMTALSRLEGLIERCKGMSRVIDERRRSVSLAIDVAAGTDVVSTLEADAARISDELESLQLESEALAPLAAELELAEDELSSQIAGREAISGDVAALRSCEDDFREIDRRQHRAQERADALEKAAGEIVGESGEDALAGQPGVLGALGTLLDVESGYRRAVDAALGSSTRATVVRGTERATVCLEELSRTGRRGSLIVSWRATHSEPPDADLPQRSLPYGARWLRPHVRARKGEVEGLLDELLRDVVVVDGGWRDAVQVFVSEPDLVVVDRGGDCFGASRWSLSGDASDIASAASEARRDAAACGSQLEQARARLEESRRRSEEVTRQIDARRADVAAMRRELEVKSATLRERQSVLQARLSEAERRLAGHSAERARAAERRRGLESDASVLDAMQSVVAGCSDRLSALRDRVRERRTRHMDQMRAGGARLETLRHERAETEARLSQARERLQRAELELAELAVRQEAAEEALRRELGTEPAEALAAPTPPLPDGVDARSRATALEAEMATLGPINPLALEELGELEERHRFLEEQIDDVRRARRQLHQLIKTVDEEIVRIFAEAFTDVNSHFQDLMSTLFPGSTGHLVLSEPSDILETGVEVEARPAGKNVRKLSLLSGGERSLVALAFLFAVFRSRPSPFYLLDEVEAALDDVNLHRFLDLLQEFRTEAQLVIVSHQKRTMEAADALYGVTMEPGGSSKVISQKVGGRGKQEEHATAG